jgi:branched-chain amino acid aminotransferase
MSVAERVVIVDGVVSPEGRVSLDADDSGLLVGQGVFETLRTYHGVPFAVSAHLERLAASAAALGVPMPSTDRLTAELHQAAGARAGESVVRVTLTGGGCRIVRAGPLPPIADGYACATRRWQPSPWLPGTIKHISRANSFVAVAGSEADEVLWVDGDDCLLEGTRSNVFAVRNGRLWTPPIDGRFLAGVTRAQMIAVARELGIEVIEAPLPRTAEVDELYLSSTLKELSPIVRLDGTASAGGGPVGQRVRDAFQASVPNG